MRARNLKPSFFKNEILVTMPFETRLLFQGLWCLADRRGRLENRPARIKMEVFPADSVDISTMLAQLQTGALISIYEKETKSYIQITNFEKHQYPHVREPDSTIPAPDKHHAGTKQAPYQHPLNPESPILNPESRIPPPGAPQGPFAKRREELKVQDLEGFIRKWQNKPRQERERAASEIIVGLKIFRLGFRTEDDIYRRIMEGPPALSVSPSKKPPAEKELSKVEHDEILGMISKLKKKIPGGKNDTSQV